MESSKESQYKPFIGCDVCKQRKRYVQAKWATFNAKKGWWHLCETHAKVVRQTLYGIMDPLIPIERKDTVRGTERSD